MSMDARRCDICQKPLGPAQFGSHCGDAQCRMQAQFRVNRRALQEHDAREQAIDEAVAEIVEARRETTGDTELRALKLPFNPNPLLPVSDDASGQIREILEHLFATIDEGEDKFEPRETISPDDQLTQVVGQMCATCNGHCCRQGYGHAFIQRCTLKRVRAKLPELTDEDILACYVNCLPEQSVANSCFFHGDKGCTLDADLRADICDAFFCRPTLGYIEATQEGRRPRSSVLAVAIHEQEIQRVRLIDAPSEP